MRPPRASLVAVGLTFLLHTPGASADEPERSALAHLHRGIDRFRAGDFSAALAAFETANRLAPDKPNPYRWMALTHVQLKQCAEAVADIDQFIARVPPNEPRVAELRRLRRLCTTGELRVASSPTGADLRVGGTHVGKTPHTAVAMRPGQIEIAASKPGYHTATRRVAIEAGRRSELHLELDRRERSVVTRWWFWTGVAAVTAGLVTGVAVALSGDDVTSLPPLECDAAGCR